MSDQQLGLSILILLVIPALIWRTVALMIGLVICAIATWDLSTQMHLMDAAGAEPGFGPFGTAFLGLLFILRYRVKRPGHDDRVYKTGTGTYYPSSGAVVPHYSTGLGREMGKTLVGGMVIIFILAVILSGIRFGAPA